VRGGEAKAAGASKPTAVQGAVAIELRRSLEARGDQQRRHDGLLDTANPGNVHGGDAQGLLSSARRSIRQKLLTELKDQTWVHTWAADIIVRDGLVHIWVSDVTGHFLQEAVHTVHYLLILPGHHKGCVRPLVKRQPRGSNGLRRMARRNASTPDPQNWQTPKHSP
jgi:hypothetical protein